MIQIFKERMTLIKKWYAAWNESQRWTLLEYVLRQQDDEKLTVIHDLLHPVLPSPDHDFTRVLPRCLCLRIFSLLDPQSLCRAAQVILVAVYKRYICIVLMKHKRHHSTSTHVHTHTRTHAYTHTHYTYTQVCWYWKYLAECNELWQRKCLRLGWFLPTPPWPYDSTVWKRHYIACVCQLHWNPPQVD